MPIGVLDSRLGIEHHALVTELGDLHRRKAKLQLVGLILAVIVASLVFWRFGMYSL
jgi:hypothetical protein